VHLFNLNVTEKEQNEYLCHFVVKEGVDYRHHHSLNPRS